MPTGIPITDDDGNRLPSMFVDANGCWIWTRSTDGKGYACSSRGPFGASSKRVHKAIWEEFNGPMPDGLQSDHLCRVRCCVNPAHIEAVTSSENNRRSMAPTGTNSRKTICIKGHALSGDNLIIKSDGNRECRTCRQSRDRESQVRRQERKLRARESR